MSSLPTSVARSCNLHDRGAPVFATLGINPLVTLILRSPIRRRMPTGDDGDFTKVSWLGTTRTARHLVRLIPPSIDNIMRNIVDNSNPQNLKIESSLLIFESINLR
jgi:hypothetical protein